MTQIQNIQLHQASRSLTSLVWGMNSIDCGFTYNNEPKQNKTRTGI
jgi:hypothetical protein